MALITAVGIVAELGLLSRFDELIGLQRPAAERVPSETRNSHLRRFVVEAAWGYTYRPWVGGCLAACKKKPQIVTPSLSSC